jgi:hypothetical protein
VSTTVEIVRFEVSPERRDALIGGHLDARRAIRAVSSPGDLWSRLAQLDSRRWVEVVAWQSRGLFEQALERAPKEETARRWFELAEPGWSILTGVSSTDLVGPPPTEGELELVWSQEAELPAAASSSKHGWSIDVRLDLRAWVDPSGWTEKERGTLRVNAAGSTTRERTETPGIQREVAVIASAIESAEVGGPRT